MDKSVVVVKAVRTTVGRRNGGWSAVHPARLLGAAQRAVLDGVDPAVINPNGGAIALGHPLGATGCVLITKAVHEMARAQTRFGVVTMCCGGGLGTATLLERLSPKEKTE